MPEIFLVTFLQNCVERLCIKTSYCAITKVEFIQEVKEILLDFGQNEYHLTNLQVHLHIFYILNFAIDDMATIIKVAASSRLTVGGTTRALVADRLVR